MKRRRYSRDQWLSWLQEHASSGLPVSVFCRQKDIGENGFYRWRNKLADELHSVDANDSFVSLELVSTDQVEIDLPCGATIRVASNEASLRPVLSVLLHLNAAS